MKSKKKLIWQIYPSYIFITLVALVIVSLFTLNSLTRFFHHLYAQDLESRALLFKSRISDYLVEQDYSAVDSACKSTGPVSSTRLTVILPSGVIAGDSEEDPKSMDRHNDRPEIIRAMAGGIGTTTRFSSTLEQNMMYVAVPINVNNAFIGVLRASVPLASIESEISALRMRIFIVGLFTILLAAGVSLFVSQRIASPIEELTRGVAHFEAGDLEYRLFVPKTQEISRLADAMNKMASQLDERIKTETRQKNKIEAVLGGMAEGVIAIDHDENLISINDAAARFFKLDPTATTGKSLTEIVRNLAFINFVKKSIGTRESHEGDICLEDLGNRSLHIRTSNLLDGENQHAGTLIVFNDVTTLRRLETMRKDFAANVSHEIRTPLTSIRGFVETLLSDGADFSEKQIHFLRIIEKNVNRLMAIIEDLLKLSRIETESASELRFSQSSIARVLESAINTLKPEAEKKNISLNLECDANIMVSMDSSMIEQAAVNLIENAIKYCGNDSAVSISVEKGETIDIHVCDTGYGIEKEHLPRLFERFYRTDKARSRQLGGTGLGLAIVKHIMLAHKGDVSVKSTIGNGSVFTLHLPAR